MQNDPLVEWQRLTETYSKMYDDELLELAADSASLTEQAQQVLGDEIRKRGLDAPRVPDSARRTSESMLERAAGAPGVDPGAPTLVRNGLETGEDIDGPQEFTWKTFLCECDGREAAWQIFEVLRRAGIESWVEGPGGSYSPYSQLDQSTPRILVPADRLDEAREIAARPIPKEIRELSQMQAPEFELPVCPKCGAGDPVLEGVDPFNSWLCEACGHEWTEAEAEGRDEPEKGKNGG
jgi:hypothetical protein